MTMCENCIHVRYGTCAVLCGSRLDAKIFTTSTLNLSLDQLAHAGLPQQQQP